LGKGSVSANGAGGSAVADQGFGRWNDADVVLAFQLGEQPVEQLGPHGGVRHVFVDEEDGARFEIFGDASDDFGRVSADGVEAARAPKHKIEAAPGELWVERVVLKTYGRTKQSGAASSGRAECFGAGVDFGGGFSS